MKKTWLIRTPDGKYTVTADKLIVTDHGDLIATVSGEAVVMFATCEWSAAGQVQANGDSLYLTEVTNA